MHSLSLNDRPPKRQLDELNINNFGQFNAIAKSLNLTIPFSSTDLTHAVGQLAYFNDVCAGGFLGRFKDGVFVVDLLVVLESYQNLGLGILVLRA
jgi:hypothetical protein